MGSADLICQKFIENRDKIEPIRTLRFTLIGSCLVGPLIRSWYLLLEKMIGTTVTLPKVLYKVALDQIFFMPLNQSMVLISLGLLKGHHTSDILEELKNKLATIVKTGWKLFPITNTIIFYFIPFLLRPLFVNIVALIWFTFVAWEANKKSSSMLENKST